ncbi:MAG TPA: DNA-formamidopyrimidine glycosylase family protein [Segeticoccus sp.]|uniref:Fpg/Nei family DNA glycosylase n=1 Tax=Segeticoccus sp. TaxID=2706531 RepID=UPI002D7F5BFC|nr:DNA-formamidopyrimidine glycosylase family protein [Segeticoccus sp.]HET8598885.1 DNA-formamidopyrimidine glycosylase family protein [Segeticoccus sp.]
MPEGDTVWRTARGLHRALAGEPLTRAELRWGHLGDQDLRGATTTEVVSRGKHLLHRLDDGRTLHSHLRMEGSWRIEDTTRLRPGTLRRDDVRAVLGTARWTAVGHRLGMLELLPTAEEDRVVGHLGPDLLGPDWDPGRAVANLRRRPERPIGAALLDQTNLAGIGTIYDSETLFAERRHPWQPVGELGVAELTRLVERARRLLEVGRAHGIPNTTGDRRRGEGLYVHGRSGRPCRRCGGPVRVAMIGEPPHERTMFYCPTCQGGLGPTDDGRPQRPLNARVSGLPEEGRPEIRGKVPRSAGKSRDRRERR